MRKLVVTHRRHKGPCKICYLVEPSARQKALSLIWLLKKNSYNHFWYPTTPLCLYLLGSCPLSPTAQHTLAFCSYCSLPTTGPLLWLFPQSKT